MPFFVISGLPQCPNFAHAIHVAKYLYDKLPYFTYKKVEKADRDWAVYLDTMNKENNWHITESPLIWKEISMWGGKKYLLGGLSEFWEFVYCYYGLESIISQNQLDILAEDNLKFFVEKRDMRQRETENRFNITISAEATKHLTFVVEAILDLEFVKNHKPYIKLFDVFGMDKVSKIEILEDIAEWANDLRLFELDEIATVVTTEFEAVESCDILITMYDCRRLQEESEEECLFRSFNHIHRMAEVLQLNAKHNLRVIMCDYGPTCFMATVLIECCPKIKPWNVVVVTADEGLSVINAVSEKTNIPVNQISAPTVWGFSGISSFVDERNIVFKAYMLRPYERAITAPRGATLPLGTKKSELRLMSYLMQTDHNELMEEIKNKKEKANRLFWNSKCRCLASLLRLWYNRNPTDDIISLGVFSNGSFGIPHGMFFSQPVILNEKNKWVPYTKFPLMNEITQQKINEYYDEGYEICARFGLLSVKGQVLDDDLSYSSPDDNELKVYSYLLGTAG